MMSFKAHMYNITLLLKKQVHFYVLLACFTKYANCTHYFQQDLINVVNLYKCKHFQFPTFFVLFDKSHEHSLLFFFCIKDPQKTAVLSPIGLRTAVHYLRSVQAGILHNLRSICALSFRPSGPSGRQQWPRPGTRGRTARQSARRRWSPSGSPDRCHAGCRSAGDR